MLWLAQLAERGPFASAAVAAGLILAALLLPAFLLTGVGSSPLLLFVASSLSVVALIASAAIVAFVVLRHGEMAALQVLAVCVVLLIVVSLLLNILPGALPVTTLSFWLPGVFASIVLARTRNLNMAVLATLVCGLVAVLGTLLFFPDVTAFWKGHFEESFSQLPAEQLQISSADIEAASQGIAELMTMFIGVTAMMLAMGTLFLARSWQAALLNPGGFKKEFHALSLGRGASLVCVVVVLLAFAVGGQWWRAAAMVFLFAFFTQGLAVLHSLVRERGLNKNWLVGIYLLMIVPQTTLLLSALGLADNLYGLRRS